MDPLLQETSSRMQKVLDLLKQDLATIRTGRAAPSLVENIVVNAYGGSAHLRIMELATVAAQDLQTLIITPFDHATIQEIQKGIELANIGVSPVIDSNLIRITLPPLSQERRQDLIHLMKQKLENGKILVRQARQDGMNDLKKDEDLSEDELHRLEKEIQKLTDDAMSQVDALGKQKEEELLQI
ncbi:MAG TPA: ribosome recycling factor [Candidatus Saccharimonadales bacterium]|nr:ribosome recycling factor [Candidatus Saccharimonadales bacterium]